MTYHDPSDPFYFFVDEEMEERFETPCENVTFYHIEIEYVGDTSYTYSSVLEKENDPIIFKIRNATLLEWDLTISGKEEIWFDKPPEINLKSNRNKKDPMRSVCKNVFSNHYEVINLLIYLKRSISHMV